MIDAPSLLIHFLTHPFSALLPTEFPNALPALTQTSARQMIRDSKEVAIIIVRYFFVVIKMLEFCSAL
jgi:hypothetical protein